MFIIFLLKNIENSKLEISINQIENIRMENIERLLVSLEIKSKDKIYFCPWGFVVNSIQYKDILEKTEKDIKEKLEEMDGISVDFDKLLLNDYEIWEKNYGRFALPIWDFDLMYNVEKRLMIEEDELVETDNIQKIIRKIGNMYRRCRVILGKQDKSMDGKTELEDTFKNCPAIKDFGSNNFESVFETIWLNVMNRETDLSQGIVNFYEEEIQES